MAAEVAAPLGVPPPIPAVTAAEPVISTRGMKNQVRIRGPKPDVQFDCKSLDAMGILLRKHIELCKNQPIPESVYAQFIFDSEVVFLIQDLSDGIREHFPTLQNHPYPLDAATVEPGPLPVTEVVSQVDRDVKLKLKRQRAVGRAILRCIQDVDGFNYFEKEAWDTKHQDGYRFKYLCRDSYQNKDRSANKARKSEAGTPTAFQAVNNSANSNGNDSGNQSPSKENPLRLPTYDCKGSIFIKFSTSNKIVDVVYQHLPIHNSTNLKYDDPTPAPNLPNGTSHEDSGDPMDTTEVVSYETPNTSTPQAAPVPEPTKSKKRKRATKQSRASLMPEDYSDIDDLDDDWGSRPPPLPLVDPGWEPDPGDGDLWKPSVVTRVPGLKAQMKQAVKASFKSGPAASPDTKDDSSASGSDFGEKKPVKKKATKPKAKAAAASASTASPASKSGATQTSTAKATAAQAKELEPSIPQLDGANDSDRGGATVGRKRTKTGCWTCRNRKLKCDEVRPQCSQCARSRPPRDCSFPEDGVEGEDLS